MSLLSESPNYTFGTFQKCMNYALLTGFCAGVLQPEYAKVFESCSAEDIARIMKSFALENCQINEPYLELLKRRLGGESSSKRLFCKVLVELFKHFLNRNAMNSTSLFKSFTS